MMSMTLAALWGTSTHLAPARGHGLFGRIGFQLFAELLGLNRVVIAATNRLAKSFLIRHILSAAARSALNERLTLCLAFIAEFGPECDNTGMRTAQHVEIEGRSLALS